MQEIKSAIDKYDLKVACTHREPENYINNIEAEIEFYKTIGCDICETDLFDCLKTSYDFIKTKGF